MKNNWFWKVCAFVFLVFLAAWVWGQSIYFVPAHRENTALVIGTYRINKITGAVHVHLFDSEGAQLGWWEVRKGPGVK